MTKLCIGISSADRIPSDKRPAGASWRPRRRHAQRPITDARRRQSAGRADMQAEAARSIEETIHLWVTSQPPQLYRGGA